MIVAKVDIARPAVQGPLPIDVLEDDHTLDSPTIITTLESGTDSHPLCVVMAVSGTVNLQRTESSINTTTHPSDEREVHHRFGFKRGQASGQSTRIGHFFPSSETESHHAILTTVLVDLYNKIAQI
jgi:hypothetical protein